MRKYLLVFMLLLIAAAGFAQPKKKSANDKPPTQKEMNEMMKEMEKAMAEMDPQDKKMLDSMGVKLPPMNSIPQFSDKKLADAWKEETQLVPKRNAAKISAIPPAPPVSALPLFISKVHSAVVAKLSPAEKTDAETVYRSIKQKPGISTANAAISFWIQQRPLLATYLMGKACGDDPEDINNINNYAAMLTMTGAEQAAIPILQNLNKRYPKNSTVLNNLGQAWFGLGDIDKANRYLDSAIRIYAYHSQANYTKSLIAESKGNTKEAVDAMMRSIQKSHSIDKESRLRKLGKKISGKDIDFPFSMPQDPLGLEKFKWPEYPMNVSESALREKEWDLFRQNCNEELAILNAKSAQLEQIALDAMKKRTDSFLKTSAAGKPFEPLPWFAAMAALKLNYLIDDKDGSMAHRLKKQAADLEKAVTNEETQQELRAQDEKSLEAKYDPLIGEGRPNPLLAYCNAVNDVRSKYLVATNSHWRMIYKGVLEDERKMINAQVYYAQYTNWPEEFEVVKIQAKIKWLNLIKSQVVKFQMKGPFCTDSKEKQTSESTALLQEFDEVACQYKSSVDIGLMEFNNNCSRLEGKLKLGVINYTRKIDSDHHDKLLSASLEIQVSAGKGIEKGPVQAEVTAKLTGRIEWNDKKVTNVQVSAEATVSVGSNLGYGDKSIDIAGINAQMGMSSGASLTGKGLLGDIDIK